MFDPERDVDDDSRRFFLRLVTLVAIAGASCAALLPSVTAFTVGVDGEKGCVAVLDGWHLDRPGLDAAEKTAESTGFVGTRPAPEQQRTLERADAYLSWRDGPGACIPESRHRLILSALGLTSVGALAGFVTVVRRTRKNLRPSPAEFAEV